MERLRGKVALVTGGASGIGEATVRLFVDEGASMVLADLQDERGRSVAKDAGPRAVYVHADVSREADVAAMVDETVRRFGRLDCLFNNAGFAGVHGPIDEIGVEGFDATIAVLLRGVFLGMLQPIRRPGLPEDIAHAALWLASDESSFVNGHALVVDGGLTGGRLWSETEQRRVMLKSLFDRGPA